MSLTKQEKIRHLLRRFGLGASYAEVEYYDKLGVDGTIDRLINYDKVDEGFDISPMAFSYDNKNGKTLIRPEGIMAWWTLRMLTTQRPLQEKLTLFWHDHFAVSASKVNQAPMMLQYLNTLRQYAAGNFHDMLLAMSKDAAMIKWLDNDTNVKGKPNENFAREVMELFTLGIGHYTEKDIQEAARAFTGWSSRINVDREMVRRSQKPPAEIVQDLMEKGQPIFVFNFRPNLHDDGMKTVLGNEGAFGGEEICGILAAKPETAKLLSHKLWEWFAYEKPDDKIVDRLSKTYLDGNMEIKPMLRKIAEADEFWSDKCVRKLIKNPVDFTLAIFREMGLGPAAAQAIKDAEGKRNPLPAIRGADQMMERQGMKLLFPPDVAGWDWGTAWINSATMIERIKVADLLFGGRGAGGPLAMSLLDSKPHATAEQIVDSLMQVVDAQVAPDRKKALVEACNKAGGADAASNPREAAAMADAVYRVLFAAPEFQFC